ncbi:hypothetical protein [Lactiplantibacillus mudanjiangensis]|uniref:Uncharacterized protein n=1 Tax=Lactiplantibacillus mudanjiangensis TaxID=1296538 RepID=A0A660DZS9_9LACO|nr:hypothetical protein [Lactiplantibacillus mudanjiangensis]VDG21325.1 hypothetical protein [Lactobacillus sp. CBA3605] [Lactiplantibacillus mudanjiangensis]VDG23598.1 hypothetical protein [Lactobacillus sp. CBA3605] [Lactiplantibacillus mudanjiangensis]VDG27061.1 hypothetical protein [Lactobacillus sp. CBA3605] [Lactiplantibacillus mudanjiangensis]VDG32158.1 hypothetical protein [Lactobacillus sp. CBA3605] [Lactiplantibacillus mudanjiangensis]
MPSSALINKYLTKYQLTLQHPEHGMVLLTSSVWLAHPELQQAISQAVQGLKGIQQVTATSPEQLILRYDSSQLRQLNPLTLLSLERQLSRQYKKAGY